MKPKEMINRLRSRFSEQALSLAVDLETNHKNWMIEELTEEQLTKMYHRLIPEEIALVEKQAAELHIRNLRAIVLKDAQYLGLHDVQDWNRFNNFMLKYSPYHKPLKNYTEDEMELLIKQLKSMRTKYEREAKIPYSNAWYHKNKLSKPSLN